MRPLFSEAETWRVAGESAGAATGVLSEFGERCASGVLLRSKGLRVSPIKIDPYLNVDAGTMSPYEHGECFVLNDGSEVDLDLGNYERFLDVTLTGEHNMTSGKVYKKVLEMEREGAYLGKTVQMVPHVTDAIQSWINRVACYPVDGSRLPPDVCLVEVGGTVGDIESAVHLEAFQQLSLKVGRENFCLGHVSYVPCIGEQKTKPTQHGVKVGSRLSAPTELSFPSEAKVQPLICARSAPDDCLSLQELRRAGLIPDFIFCRSGDPITDCVRHKIALFSQVEPQHVSASSLQRPKLPKRLALSQRFPLLSLALSCLCVLRYCPSTT